MSSKRKHRNNDSMPEISKKQCTETIPHELSILERLPMEVLENICSFISGDEILELLLTSKIINATIANSCRIMQRFNIAFAHINKLNDQKFVSVCPRKYSCIIIPFIRQYDLDSAVNHLKKYAERVKEITFEKRSTSSVIIKILEVCKNVSKINSEAHLSYEDRGYARPVNFPHLKSLDIFFSRGPIINLFLLNTHLKEINIIAFSGNPKLKPFLEKQESLEVLRISEAKIFDEPMCNVKYKLKVLNIAGMVHYRNPDYVNPENFLTFVRHHKESLEHLTTKIRLLGCFLYFPHLKTVNLSDWNNNYSMPMRQVKYLSIKISTKVLSFSKVYENYPNLKQLRIEHVRSKTMMDFTFNLHMLNLNSFDLESLHLVNCKFPESLRLPETKRLIIEDMKVPVNTALFTGLYLQRLTVKNCSELNWIVDIIDADLIVEHLYLQSLLLPKSIHDAIINNPQKFHRLSLERVEIN